MLILLVGLENLRFSDSLEGPDRFRELRETCRENPSLPCQRRLHGASWYHFCFIGLIAKYLESSIEVEIRAAPVILCVQLFLSRI